MGSIGVTKDKEGPGRRRGLIIGIALPLLIVTIMVSVIMLLGETVLEDRSTSSVDYQNVTKDSVDRILLKSDDLEDFEYHRDEALRKLNSRVEQFILGNVLTVDAEDEGFHSLLFRDIDAGGLIYWEFYVGDIMFRVDALTGDVLNYWHYNMSSDRGLNKSAATELMTAIAIQFGPLPDDRDVPLIYPQSGLDDQNRSPVWVMLWNRTYEGITTTDRIIVMVMGNGTLRHYYKGWQMDLEGLDTAYITTMDEANTTAMKTTGGNAVPTSCERRIIRPTYGHTGHWVSGASPTCVWEVEFHGDHSGRPKYWVVWVDAKDPDKVVGAGPISYG